MNKYSTKTLKNLAQCIIYALISSILLVEPALAQGGLSKVNTFMDNILAVLRGISLTVVTIAFMWAGYKFLFKQADIGEVGKILGGGLFIGGAAELAAWLIA